MAAHNESKSAKARKNLVKPREVRINVPGIKVPHPPFYGFIQFIRGNAVVALAIGLFLGTSLKSILDAFTTNVVNPIIGVTTGNLNLSNMAVCIKHSDGLCKSNIQYGLVISSVISFLIAAFMVYLIVRLLRLDKLDQKKEDK